MEKQEKPRFGILLGNAVVDEVSKNKSQMSKRSVLMGHIVRVEGTDFTEDRYLIRNLKSEDTWETMQFFCDMRHVKLIPEKLWPFLQSVPSTQARVRFASNESRCEKLLQITVDMVVGYEQEDNVLLGVVKYIGNVRGIGKCFGLKLHERQAGSMCNGSCSGVQYFPCLPGFGMFATIDKLVAHNVLNRTNVSPTPPVNIPEMINNIASLHFKPEGESPKYLNGFTSSQSSQSLRDEIRNGTINTTNDFDQNTILQPDSMVLLQEKKALRHTLNMQNLRHECDEVDFRESKLAANYSFYDTNNASSTLGDRNLVKARNKSMNPISHMMSSKTVPRKSKLLQDRQPTFKSYEKELNERAAASTTTLPPFPTQPPPPPTTLYIEPDSEALGTRDLSIGTLVQISTGSESPAESPSVVYGVVRWVGMEATTRHLLVGVELEEELDQHQQQLTMSLTVTDGTYNGQRLFRCAGGCRAVFVPAAQCHRDMRFQDGSSTTTTGMGVEERVVRGGAGGQPGEVAGAVASGSRVSVNDEKQFGKECAIVKGFIPPLMMESEEDVEAVCGKFRGIQGHHNSCYLDATLFSMFTYTSVFDSLLYRPRGPNDIPEYDEVQRVLREEIVNPLRCKLFVRADRVMTLRRLLDQLSSVSGLTSEEKDPEEFLNSLLAQILHAEPFLKLNSGQESYYYQLFVEKDDSLKLPTVQQLFEQSFLTSDIKLTEVPSCLIIQMPRFGKSFKMYPRILPSQLLDVTDIIENSPRVCNVCGELARWECKQCYHESDEGLENTSFCARCSDTMHQHSRRATHTPRPLSVPHDYEIMAEHCPPPRLYMELFAVVCIETSHYVTFVKCGVGHEAPWCFFDSMADRKGEKNGYNIPEMVACPDVAKWLSDEEIVRSLHKSLPVDRHLPEHARRLLCDAYICMYQSSDVMMYR